MKNNIKTINRKKSLGLLSISAILALSGLTTIYAAGPAPVNLLSANNFTILAKTGISTTGTTLITGDIGVSPNAATSITGFGLNLTDASPFATSPTVVGKIYAPNYANPTPTVMTTAISDMETAYTDGAGRVVGAVTELGAGNIGGLTLAPGLYKWGTGVTIPTDVTLSGNANDVWIFQIAQNLDLSSATKIVLAGGAQANNIFWIVAGQTTIGTTAVFNGNILDQTAIVLNTGAVLNGRALAQTAVTLDSNIVTSQISTTSAIPAIPATPTSETNTAPIPATPAIPATSSSQNTNVYTNNNSNETGCSYGNNFSITTGRPCISVSNSTNTNYDAGCLSGNRFSITTGHICNSSTLNNSNNNSAGSSNLGQEIKMIKSNCFVGNRNDDVKTIQLFLISQNKGVSARNLASVGATSYFGDLTRSALAEYQASVGITPPLGNFGSITRAYINSH